MTDGVRVEGSDDLDRIAHALKAAADKDLQKAVSAAMRDVAKPLGLRVIRTAAEEMPASGGFRAHLVAGGKAGVSNSLRGRTASVTIRLSNKGRRYSLLDRGILRHPVHANPERTRKQWAWVNQSVPAQAFTRAFKAEASKVRTEVLDAAQGVLNDVARKA